LPPGLSSKALGGVFTLDWICRKELPFSKTLHLCNLLNEGKPVKIARDGQVGIHFCCHLLFNLICTLYFCFIQKEIDPRVGEELCRLFPQDESVDLKYFIKRMKKQSSNKTKLGYVHSSNFRNNLVDSRRPRMPHSSIFGNNLNSALVR